MTSSEQDAARSAIINRDSRHILRGSARASALRESRAWVLNHHSGLQIGRVSSRGRKIVAVSWFTSRTACGLLPSSDSVLRVSIDVVELLCLCNHNLSVSSLPFAASLSDDGMINDVVDETIIWPLNPTLSCSIWIAEEVNDVQTDVTYAEIMPIRESWLRR